MIISNIVTTVMVLFPFAVAFVIAECIAEGIKRYFKRKDRMDTYRATRRAQHVEQAKKDMAEMAILANYYGGINCVR